MKYQTLKLFLIILLSSLLILTIVDVNNHKHKTCIVVKTSSHNDEHKTCTFTQTSSQTVTISTCVSNLAYETSAYKGSDKISACVTQAYKNYTYKIPAYETSAYETQNNHISHYYNNDRRVKHNNDRRVKHKNNCKKTITITFTPTTTLCFTPTLTCCQSSSSLGWQNVYYAITNNVDTIFSFNITNAQGCCKNCLNDLDCIQ
ncbi:2964_t:CDS:1 [Dentiscutata heterogama]|uniref:2964_t:CDS:1 n=1 Tax=Dentiscutata heterogama TaxID=1316150 RepID=A0ACA9KLR8_9GLOM|nr:2964_t:CDS:1 [Dentiscutata heterogama]